MPGKNVSRSTPDPGRVWNLDDIQGLLDLLAKKEITEFEMEQQGVKIRVRRGDSHVVSAGNVEGFSVVPGSASPGPTPAASPVPLATVPSAPSGITSAAEAAADSTEGLVIIKSPIVGTFYSSPSPSAPPFVKVGDTVQMGQVICIIEAMKLMNELEAEMTGQIVRVYVENGQPVEYGQSLFAIEPARKK
jgi:acetyl-CoA carboxylase biotin carboxyl carrier protein